MRVLQFGRFWNDQHGVIERSMALLGRELAAMVRYALRATHHERQPQPEREPQHTPPQLTHVS